MGTCSPASTIRPSVRRSGRQPSGALRLLDGKYGHLQLNFKACYVGVGDHLLASFLFIRNFITKVGRVLNCCCFFKKGLTFAILFFMPHHHLIMHPKIFGYTWSSGRRGTK